MLTWVTVLFDSPRNFRKKLKSAVLDGIELYNAKFKKVGVKSDDQLQSLQDQLEGKTEYKIVKKDPSVQQFVKDLRNEKNFEFIGFADQCTYIKDSGSNEQLEALWEHPFGSAALLYKVKGLPALIITGPDIDFNDSIRNKIKSNSATRTKTYGVTG